MWILFARSPLPDASHWPGRCVLAVFDALLWPGAWLTLVLFVPFHTGSVGVVAGAGLTISAISRLRCAWCRNARYRFTAWRWSGLLIVAAGVGAFAKLVAG